MKKKLTADQWWDDLMEYERAHEIAFALPGALRRAAHKVHTQNRKLGLPIILWQDGKVVEKPA